MTRYLGRVRRLLLCAVLLALVPISAAGAIVGGRPATEPYPFTVSLEDGGEHVCGASLLAADRVLTAAHCVQDADAEDLTVVVGRTDLRTAAGEELAVAGFEIHPNYASDEAGGHDVAVLRLARPSSSAPIRLAAESERALWAPGAPARVLGWGTSFFLVGPSPTRLHEVDVPMVSDARCARYDTLLIFSFDPRTMVCAGEETGLKDACQGDSGGPLVARGADGWVQVGTVSFGLGCGLPLFYGVYARVADDPLRSWIVARTGGSGTGPDTGPGDDGAGSGSGTTPAAKSPVRLSVTRRKLGSARKARRRGHLKARLRTSAPVTSVRAVLKRRDRVVARGRRASLERRGKVRLPVRKLRKGRHRLVVRAVDETGRKVRHRAAVRVRR